VEQKRYTLTMAVHSSADYAIKLFSVPK
jgi:hypothetical protein